MIKIDYQKKIKYVCDLDNKLALKIASRVFRRMNITDSDFTIELFLVDKKMIREVNRDFRQINSTTDVLSFPQKYTNSCPEKVLGSIFISPEVAHESRQNCQDLFVHGLLHLLGYDHEVNTKEWDNIGERING